MTGFDLMGRGRRCPHWEDRVVRPDWSGHRSPDGKVRQVRCSREPGHDGECRWRGTPFGVHTREGLLAARKYPKIRSDSGLHRDGRRAR